MRASAEPYAGEVATAERSSGRERTGQHIRLRAERIVRISRVVGDLDRAEDFYALALDFRTVARGAVEAEQLWALGARYATARQVVMRLGNEEIALVQFATQGRPYPPGSRSDDLWFQHLAIVADDMDAAYAQLSRRPAWAPITSGGPQLLPPASGGVRAYKFRDPDGHPLELLAFPPGPARSAWLSRATSQRSPFLGIDHTALAVRSTRNSLGFYRTLGMHLTQRSLNRGNAQAHLDGLPEARVRVTDLRPADNATPGIELLAYRPPGRADAAGAVNDMASDWVTLAFGEAASDVADSRRIQRRRPVALRDPDGHRLLLVDQSTERISPA
jgi:catechol 2,3-dioxygenase-like lactoylglutathione lyase family enzyme